MYKLLIILTLIPYAAFALEATVDFSLTGNKLTASYQVPADIDEVAFSDEEEASQESIFSKFTKKVSDGKLILETHEIESLMKGSRSPIFTHDNGNTLIYSPFFDLSHGFRKGKVVEFDKFIYRFQGKVLHTRLLDDNDSFERFLILENSPHKVHHGVHGDIILDDDLDKNQLLPKIEKSLAYLTEKLGPPRERPVIFFTFSSNDEPWYDGRVVIGSPVVMMALSRGMEKEQALLALVLYHALLSHEIAHHWNSRNLASKDVTQEEINRGAWVHEGGAEAMAHLMTKELFALELGPYVSYMRQENIRKCSTPDEDSDWEYNCGDVMYAKALEAPGVDPWKVIKAIMELPVAGETLVLLTFIKHAPMAFKDIQKIFESYIPKHDK